jgi:hypothetical protein
MESNPFSLRILIESLLMWTRENLLYLIFLFVLSMVYILNNHWAVKQVRLINKKSKELKEIRWEYLSKKSDLMYKSKLTEVLPMAEQMGLKQLENPPFIIKLKKEDYQNQK